MARKIRISKPRIYTETAIEPFAPPAKKIDRKNAYRFRGKDQPRYPSVLSKTQFQKIHPLSLAWAPIFHKRDKRRRQIAERKYIVTGKSLGANLPKPTHPPQRRTSHLPVIKKKKATISRLCNVTRFCVKSGQGASQSTPPTPAEPLQPPSPKFMSFSYPLLQSPHDQSQRIGVSLGRPPAFRRIPHCTSKDVKSFLSDIKEIRRQNAQPPKLLVGGQKYHPPPVSPLPSVIDSNSSAIPPSSLSTLSCASASSTKGCPTKEVTLGVGRVPMKPSLSRKYPDILYKPYDWSGLPLNEVKQAMVKVSQRPRPKFYPTVQHTYIRLPDPPMQVTGREIELKKSWQPELTKTLTDIFHTEMREDDKQQYKSSSVISIPPEKDAKKCMQVCPSKELARIVPCVVPKECFICQMDNYAPHTPPPTPIQSSSEEECFICQMGNYAPHTPPPTPIQSSSEEDMEDGVGDQCDLTDYSLYPQGLVTRSPQEKDVISPDSLEMNEDKLIDYFSDNENSEDIGKVTSNLGLLHLSSNDVGTSYDPDIHNVSLNTVAPLRRRLIVTVPSVVENSDVPDHGGNLRRPQSK